MEKSSVMCGSEQVTTGVQHVGIPTNDIEATIAFYEKLGFVQKLRTVNEKAGEQVCFLQLKNVCIETYQNHRAAMACGAIDHLALDVTDIEKAFACVSETGIKMLDTEIQFLPFWEKGVRFFTVEGPNREKIEFSQIL